MANIGRVHRDSYVKDKKTFPLLVLDIRTITVQKKFNIVINKRKYPSGDIDGEVSTEALNHPDYYIWYNTARKGESLPSVRVGSIKNEVSQSGLKYKKAKIFDPFISEKNIYFTLFSVDSDKKIDENHLYNVVAQPYRNMNNSNNNDTQVPQAYAKEDGSEIPMEEDEIPF